MSVPELMTVVEAARVLRLHPDTVRRLLREGRLRGVRVGRSWRVPADVAEAPVPDPLPPRRREPIGRYGRIVREIEDAA